MKLLICDDDKNCLLSEGKYITENTQATAECFLSGKELLKRLSAGTEDIAAVFMDIELDNSENGIMVAEQISNLYPDIRIIFLTAYSLKYCEEIFLAGKNLVPFALVDKQNLNVNLKRAMDKLYASLNSDKEKNKLAVTVNAETFFIDPMQTLYLESNVHTLMIVTADGNRSVRAKLSDVLGGFPPYFVQCHKSFAVNIHHIVSYTAKQIELDSQVTIPVSRKFSQSVREKVIRHECGI